ncbi:MAG TPA: hypothetical protein VGJ20_37180 [Xanthobacteraceae bacterium]|jgi:hypothetical protein
MKHYFLTLALAALWAPASSYAGPCSHEIDAMQARIDARLESQAATGPTAKEGAAAGMGVQPTPRSIAGAEEKLGEVSPQRIDAIGRAMTLARAADGAGDKSGCQQALADVQREMGR